MPVQPKVTLETILQLLGFTATVEEHPLEDGFLLDVKTEESGRLIGRQGQTLSDLQYITNRLLFQQDPACPKVMVDVGGYRSQTREALVKKAKEAAEKVRRWGDVELSRRPPSPSSPRLRGFGSGSRPHPPSPLDRRDPAETGAGW